MYNITTKDGKLMGSYEGDTPAQALLAMHREAGYGEDAVWMDEEGRLAFDSDESLNLLGGVDDWIITE